MKTLLTPILFFIILILPSILYFIYSRQIKTNVNQKVNFGAAFFMFLGFVFPVIAMSVFMKTKLKELSPSESFCFTGIELLPFLGWIFNIVGISTIWISIFLSKKRQQSREKVIANGQNKSMNFQKLMVKKNENEIEEYLTNVLAYNRDIIDAAITELKNRGRVFTEDELSSIETRTQERENTIGKNTVTVRNSLEKNIVEDESTLALYSRKTIDWTTLIFGIAVGTILMAINLKYAEKKKEIISILVLGAVYLSFEILILSLIPNQTTLFVNFIRLLLNGVGALIIHTFIWNTFIGKEFKYRKKSIFFPIILGLIIEGLFFLIWINA